MATRILISYNFYRSQNIILLLILFQPFENVKPSLSFQDIQKQAAGRIWLMGCSVPNICQDSGVVKNWVCLRHPEGIPVAG